MLSKFCTQLIITGGNPFIFCLQHAFNSILAAKHFSYLPVQITDSFDAMPFLHIGNMQKRRAKALLHRQCPFFATYNIQRCPRSLFDCLQISGRQIGIDGNPHFLQHLAHSLQLILTIIAPDKGFDIYTQRLYSLRLHHLLYQCVHHLYITAAGIYSTGRKLLLLLLASLFTQNLAAVALVHMRKNLRRNRHKLCLELRLQAAGQTF